MQHFFSEKKIDKTTLPGRKAEYDIHFIRDHKQLQVPFFMETLKKALTFCPGVYNYNRFTGITESLDQGIKIKILRSRY